MCSLINMHYLQHRALLTTVFSRFAQETISYFVIFSDRTVVIQLIVIDPRYTSRNSVVAMYCYQRFIVHNMNPAIL